MSSPGLSLVGFMGQSEALPHLRETCVPVPNSTDADLEKLWRDAVAKIGPAVANAGQPDIRNPPSSHDAYCDALVQLPWVQETFGPQVTRHSIKLVEIDPLLSFQFTVDTIRCDHHCGHLSGVPNTDQLFATCLPTTQPSESFTYQVQGQSAMIKSRSLNLRVKVQRIINGQVAGVLFGAALPLVQVVRLNGRCYLHNGFHRAVGMRNSGATHVPCIFRDVPDAVSAGIVGGMATFSEALLTSTNPPTVGHFTQKRALDVQLRTLSRILHVSWSDYVWPEE
jgi:hypothetical protein